MPGDRFTVDDIRLGARDATEATIEHIYAKAPPLYAVYRNSDRVAVQYSDNEALADRQRTDTAVLSLLRSEINGLIDGWRHSSRRTFQSRARRYDGEVAAALIQCLEEGHPEHARSVMQQTRDDVLGERISWGKSEYLIYASIAAAIGFAILTFVQHYIFTFKTPPDNLWLAGRAGTAGAFFSVAWGIWRRSIQPNIRGRDNISDAVLRIVVGMIAAGVLLLLLGTDLVPNITIGNAHVSGKAMTWEVVLIVGFLAGFVERLVPGLLDNTQQSGTATPGGGGGGQNPPARQAGGGNGPGAGGGGTPGGGARSGTNDPVAGRDPATDPRPAQPRTAADQPPEPQRTAVDRGADPAAAAAAAATAVAAATAEAQAEQAGAGAAAAEPRAAETAAEPVATARN